jgi:hypothetical protein
VDLFRGTDKAVHSVDYLICGRLDGLDQTLRLCVL